MTYDEAQQALTKMVQNPDTIAADMPAFLDLLKADYESATAAALKVAAQDEKIRSLQDSNTRLFLMQTGQPVGSTVDDNTELQGHDAVDAFVANIMKKKED